MRTMEIEVYRQRKIERFTHILKRLKQKEIKVGTPVFVADGMRRRAELTFQERKDKLYLGFNARESHELVDVEVCLALSEKLNAILPQVRVFLHEYCQVQAVEKVKNKRKTVRVTQGEIWITEADNGVDVLVEVEEKPCLEHRLLISDFVNHNEAVVRVSVGAKNSRPETVAEKSKPYIMMGGHTVFIPAGTFLQPSAAGQKALTDLVLNYVGLQTGQIADLFCGVGTFSYSLANNIKNKITAIDSSAELLADFRRTVNSLMLPNIEIVQRNLFKYPLEAAELQKFAVVIFDPPRAGAAAQAARLASLKQADKPQKVVAVSCNPNTFVNDANVLIDGGYRMTEITLVDQFVYAEHFELVAGFEKIEKDDF